MRRFFSRKFLLLLFRTLWLLLSQSEVSFNRRQSLDLHAGLGEQCQGGGGDAGKNPAWSPQPSEQPHTPRGLGLIQDSGQRSESVRKGCSCKGEAGHPSSPVPPGRDGLSFLPLHSNSVTLGINLFLKKCPSSALSRQRTWTGPPVFSWL